MTIYMLRPPPSKVWQLRLVFRLRAGVVPSVDVLLGVIAVVRFLVVGAPPIVGTRARRVAVLNIKPA
jgi:hypothetical protein